jgi:hypothetical protein
MPVAYRINVGDKVGYQPHAGGELWVNDLKRTNEGRTIEITLNDDTIYELNWDQWIQFPRREGAPQVFTYEILAGALRCGDGVMGEHSGPAPYIIEHIDTSVPGTKVRITAYNPLLARRIIIARALTDPTCIDAAKIRMTSREEVDDRATYRHKYTQARFRFTRHPHGAGRWPAGIFPYDARLGPHPGGGVYECRYTRFVPKDLEREES